MNQHPVDLFHVYGWRKLDRYFVTSGSTQDEAIKVAKDSLGKYPQTTVENVRENRIVWDSNEHDCAADGHRDPDHSGLCIHCGEPLEW